MNTEEPLSSDEAIGLYQSDQERGNQATISSNQQCASSGAPPQALKKFAEDEQILYQQPQIVENNQPMTDGQEEEE